MLRQNWLQVVQALGFIVALGTTIQSCDAFSQGRSPLTPSAQTPDPGISVLQPTPIRIQVQDLPAPFATESASQGPQEVERPATATFKVPAGFTVNSFAQGLSKPRWLLAAPNGDIFLAESHENRIRLLRDRDQDGVAEFNSVFVAGLNQPFGMAIAPDQKSFYIANTDAVWRYPYQLGQTQLQSQPIRITDLPGNGYRQHWTRNLLFSPDGAKLYVSIGSESNADPENLPRASIQVMNPDGSDRQTYASGLRNPVGLAIHPTTHRLYTTVNERDKLGDDLVPDYLTGIQPGGFYGWPYWYLGQNRDPRLPEPPTSKTNPLVPDVLFQSHSAALGLVFYTGTQFPSVYRNDAFVAFRGSWNRSQGTGYKVVRVPFDPQGKPKGSYEDFLTGWLLDPKIPTAWGRPVGLAVTQTGALLVTDESGGIIWQVRYNPNQGQSSP